MWKKLLLTAISTVILILGILDIISDIIRNSSSTAIAGGVMVLIGVVLVILSIRQIASTDAHSATTTFTPAPGDRLVIVLVDDGMDYGASVISSVVGNSSYEKCRFVGRVFSSTSGTHDSYSVPFHQENYEHASINDKTDSAQTALTQLRREIESDGWRPTGKGADWFSYQYQWPMPFQMLCNGT